MMTEEVKKEIEDGDFEQAAPHPLASAGSGGAGAGGGGGGGEEDASLSQLSSPGLNSFSGKGKSPMEGREKRVIKIKRRHSDSKFDQGVMGHAGKNCICCKPNKPVTGGTPHGETKSPALIRAEEVQSNLEKELPSFIKTLVRSHVGSCFWMGLPGPFCRAHLPHEDAIVTLEDECGEGFQMKYIAHKTGLSAGWRQFCTAHQLLEGDVCVFQLVGSCRFRVYIIRANDLAEVDGALGLLNLDAQPKQNDSDNAEMTMVACNNGARKRPRSLPVAVIQKRNRKSVRARSSVPKSGQATEQSENDSEEVGSEVLEGFKLPWPAVQFKDVQSYENFNIQVDGLVLDSELPEDVRLKYYNLCCSLNAFLHESLLKGINLKLTAGIISETVNIADALRACSLTTSKDEFATWDKTLKASELLGMNVGFLRARLKKLLGLAFDSEDATKARRYVEARNELVHTDEEIKNLEEKLKELKSAYERYEADIQSLKSKAESYEHRFEEEALAPW